MFIRCRRDRQRVRGGWMDRQACRQTDTQTHTGIILCVILSVRVRVQCKETDMFTIFTPTSCMCVYVCVCPCVRVWLTWLVFKSATLWACVYMWFGISVCVCVRRMCVSLRDRWTDRRREQHRLDSRCTLRGRVWLFQNQTRAQYPSAVELWCRSMKSCELVMSLFWIWDVPVWSAGSGS